MPTDKVMERHKPVEIQKAGNNRYHIKFAEEISGWVALDDIQVAASDTIHIKYISESLVGKQVYVCKGGGESHAPRFGWFTVSEVEIAGWKKNLAAENITADVIYTEVETTGILECSNLLFNRIERLWWRSQTDNMHEGIVSDCPHRERSVYIGDGQAGCATAMYRLDMNAVYTRWIGDIRGAQIPTAGYVPSAAPW